MLFTKKRSAHALGGASMMWHHSLLLMNSFNKTEAAVFSYRLCFLRVFHFISLVEPLTHICAVSVTNNVASLET